MIAISLFGIVLFAVQVGLGYYAYQSLSSVSRVTQLAAGILTTGAGFVVLFRYGVVATLLLDIGLFLALTVVRGSSGR